MHTNNKQQTNVRNTMLTPRSDGGGGDTRHGNTCAGVHKKGVRHVLLMSSHTPCLTGQLTKNATQKHVGPHAGASMPPPTGVTTNVRVRACVRGSEKNVGVEGYAVSMKPPQQHTCSTQAPRGQPSPCGSCLGPYQGGRRLGRRLPVQQRAAQRGVPPHRPSTSQPLPRGCHPHKGGNPKEVDTHFKLHTTPHLPPAAGPPSCTPPGASPSARARHCGLQTPYNLKGMMCGCGWACTRLYTASSLARASLSVVRVEVRLAA